MAAVEITISGVLYDKTARTTQPVVLIGEAFLTGLTIGGGPIIPPGETPKPPIPGHPSHPIYPGEHPEHPIVLPPDQPTEPPMVPSEPKPPPEDGGWGWFPPYGWGYFPGTGGAGPKG